MSTAAVLKTPEQAQVSKKKGSVSPFDRLPVKVAFNAPPPNSPYHTQRAADARENARTYLPAATILKSAQALVAAGLQRRNADIEDTADHNALTLAAALTYAGHGLNVVDAHALFDTGNPTNSGHAGIKVPRGAKWQERATTDAAQIERFWTGRGEYPENAQGEIYPYARVSAPRNVSIAFTPGCGLFALDIDGEKGQEALAKLEAEHGALPETVTSLSGSQTGFHMIFRASEPILNTASAIAPGVDIRGEGGQIIAPPSVHPTFGFYEWEEGHAPGEVEIADAPEWLVKAALAASKKSSGGRRLRPEGQAPSREYEPVEPTGDSRGFAAHLANIGDHAAGFDKPIYRAACAWFGAHGWDADASTLLDQLEEAIIAAPCDDGRNEDRYATPAYLEGRVEQALDYIATAEAQEAAFCAAGTVEEEGATEGTAASAAVQQDIADDPSTLDITGPLGDSMRGALMILNRRFKAANVGGDLVFIRVPDFSIENESRMEMWKEPALRRWHDDRKVQVKKIKTDKNGKETETVEWVNPVIEFAATTKRHSRVEFAPPPACIPATAYNTFHGFQLASVAGDCAGLKEFIRDVICAGDADVFKWVWHWLAHLIQRPGEKPGTALVIHGAGGAGKGTFGDLVRALVYPYAMLAVDSDDVLGQFAGPALANSLVVVAEEAFFAGDKKASNKLKSYITSPRQRVEQKHVNAFEMRSYTRYIFDSNDDHVVNIEGNGSERRFCVIKVSDSRAGDQDFFEDLQRQINGPELAALAWELQQYDPASAGMEWGDVRRAPETTDRKRMSYQSRNPAERALLKAIEEGRLEFNSPTGGVLEYDLNHDKPTRISTQHCRDFLRPHANKFSADSDDVLKLAERIFGKDHGFTKSKGMIDIAGEREQKNRAYFAFPPGDVLCARMRELGYL